MKALAAIAEDGGIGYQGKIPWKIKQDFQWFKECTLNQKIIVGHTTYKDLPPLPNRTIFVLSKEQRLFFDLYCAFYHQTEKGAIQTHYCTDIGAAGPDAWLCGGAQIYKEFLPRCNEVYVTHVKGIYPADVYFPFSQQEIEAMFPKQELFKEFDGGHKVVRYYK